MSCSKKYYPMYIDIADVVSRQSYATRAKVGCVIVKDDRIIALSYNGTPKGANNDCEERLYVEPRDLIYSPFDEIIKEYPLYDEEQKSYYRLVTKGDVIHAELNAILQVARSNESIDGGIMFVTHSPCENCAKHIAQSGIKEVVFRHSYRKTDGLNYLKNYGIAILHMGDQHDSGNNGQCSGGERRSREGTQTFV